MTSLTTRPSGKLAMYVFLKTITLRYVFANQKLKAKDAGDATREARKQHTNLILCEAKKIKKRQRQGIELRPSGLKMTTLTNRPSGKLAVYVFLKTITLRYVFANQGRTRRQGAAKVG